MRLDPSEISVGIDLGTTNCAMAMINSAGRSEMIMDELGQPLTPSVLYFDTDAVRVGREAIQASNLDAAGFLESPKRELGLALSQSSIRGRHFEPEFLQACVLAHLKEILDRRLQGTYRCVVGVPAFFDQARRQRTMDAIQLARLPFLELVNEPTAAALAYGENTGYFQAGGATRAPQRVLVYDLGGGTFDVTVIELAHGEIVTLATDGDVRLGGNDWDQRVFDYLAQKFESRFRIDVRDDPDVRLRLRRQARELKESLSARQRVRAQVDFGDKRLALEITREQFELLTSDLLERTMQTTREVVQQCNLAWNNLDGILLSGGATRMPMVARMLREITGHLPQQAVNPDEAVARGSALWGILRRSDAEKGASHIKTRVVEVAPHSLGIEGIDVTTGRRENRILIPRNTPLPAVVVVPFATRRKDQESIMVRVLEGESLNPDECATIGHAILDQLPPMLRRGHPLHVVYALHDGDSLEVRLSILDQQQEWTMRLERSETRADSAGNWRQLLSGPGRFLSFEDLVRRILGV